MIEIDMLHPKSEEMALKNHFILPLWKQSKKTGFMLLIFRTTYVPSCYTLKKVIAHLVSN